MGKEECTDGDRCVGLGIGCWDVYSRDIRDCGDGRTYPPISVAARDGGLLSLAPSTDWPLAALCRRTVEVRSNLLVTGVATWMGVPASGVDSLRALKGLEPSRLVRRASNRLMTLELVLASGSMLAPRRSLGSGKVGSLRCAVEMASLLPGRILALTKSASGVSSAKAIQSSVRLRHILSAVRRSRLSVPLTGPTTEAPSEPALPVMAAKFKASDAVTSNAL